MKRTPAQAKADAKKRRDARDRTCRYCGRKQAVKTGTVRTLRGTVETRAQCLWCASSWRVEP